MAYPRVGDSVLILASKCYRQKGVVKQIRYSSQVYLIEFSDGALGELYLNQFCVV